VGLEAPISIVTAILKTLPSRFARGQMERFLGVGTEPCFTTYFFTLGRGRPGRADIVAYSNSCQLEGWTGIDELWFTHQGVIIGYFAIEIIVQNVGQLPLLTTLDGNPSEWQIKPDRWVAVCLPPFHQLEERVFHEGFRGGWRYFDLAKHSASPDSKIQL
jgi:hypothetical protein